MKIRVCLMTAAFAALAVPAMAQNMAADAIKAAEAAMGTANVRSITYTAGGGWVGAVGQNFVPDQDWPRFDIKSYTRTIDFATNSSHEDMTIVQGNNPARGGGGTPIVGEQRRVQRSSGAFAWNMQGNNAVPAPQAAELRQVEICTTPMGFLKCAAANNPAAIRRQEYGSMVTVVSFTYLGKYRINGTINDQNLVQRTQTWVPNPVAGDMYYETVYTLYRDIGGLKLPMRWHQHQDYDDGGLEPNVQGGDHAFDLEQITDVKLNVENAALTVPDNVRAAQMPQVRIESQRLADGVWLIGGGTHNSLAVEFRDHIAVIEGPLNEARSIAVIDETRRLIPNKPIKYVVNTHHHWDHSGGLRTFAHEGITIVTHEQNLPFYREMLNPVKRFALAPDRFYLNPPEEWSEGAIFESVHQKYILGDDTHTVELHLVQGLQHAGGMLIAYFPKEKILVNADLYTPPAAGQQAPAVNASNRALFDTIRRLNLNVDTHVPIHGNPGSQAGFQQFMGRN